MGAEQVPIGALTEGVATLVERLRGVHQEMVDAALAGAGIGRVAELAGIHARRPVAIVVPSRAVAVASPTAEAGDGLPAVESYVAGLLESRPAPVPPQAELVVPISSTGEIVGAVAMLTGADPPAAEAGEFLHLASLATVTILALEDAREQDTGGVGGFVEEIRAGEHDAREVARRAARHGCDLARGAVVLVTEIRSSRPRQAAALVAGDYQGALAEITNGRLYAILPARGADEAPEATTATAAATALAERLRGYGPTGRSSFYAHPGELRRALQEAELVLDVVSHDEGMAEQLNGSGGSGVYRLLFRALASHPEEVRSFYEDTVAPLVHYDDQYHTDLLATLESYLANDCNMNATARTIYAHRHTVAYRLQRVKELSGLDPMLSEERERLSLGLKAYRIVAPTLPR